MAATIISTSIQYLARSELYETEKPYAADFEVEEQPGVKKSNYILASQEIAVQSIDAADTKFDLDTHGFCVVKAKTSLQAEDALRRPQDIETSYIEELQAILHKQFPQYSRFEAMEFVVRKRDERFPSDEVAVVDYEQPACLAHSDFSVNGAVLQLKASFPGQEMYFLNKEYDMINVWRPLVGPNNDWPLAVCDYTSIDTVKDTIAADVLHRDRVAENQLLWPNAQHCWYFIKDQQPEDLLVFRNVDSTGKRAKAFHAAFLNPQVQGPPRTSCEVRFVAFR